ncbi:alginate O-acetyltransferase AlgX-related protein [Candidatus Magnetominusculus xianensis]|uniref:AlgX/AlgJ SGNH hydrolase-like domain-containing protein n=1 Tax=Candidatus Magnetominusculus xianensis TaxID=1748249 RepID=A0ABR5SK32_9BACT|nr:hypothetical protein [Candidatus Magnetominusculus xianensis]KWT93550.1 hypothetical protein ASN18_0300 [Candidatus Magnetominusculus xianensis]MBF0405682.1 hypothetical protein [Nitrospirota bacterium]
MILSNESWSELKDSLVRFFFNELLLKILITLLTVSAVYLFCEKLNSYLLIKVIVHMRSSYDNNPRLYFHNKRGEIDIENSVMSHINQSEGFRDLKFKIPKEIKDPMVMSFFVGEKAGVIEVKSIEMKTVFKSYKWLAKDIMQDFVANENIAGYELVDDTVRITSKNNTPFISNWTIGSKYDTLVRSIDKHYLSYVFAVVAAVLVFFIIWRRPLPSVDPRGKSIFNISTASVFVFFISLPFLSTIFLITYKVTITEQRSLATKPRLNFDTIASFPGDYTKYYEDNFGFRDIFIRWNNMYKVKLLNSSPIPDQVVFGHDDWLFLSAQRVLDDYKGIKPFTPVELANIKHTLLERQRWLAQRGMKYYVIIAPNKETIYPEYLPDFIKKVGPKTRTDQLIEYMGDNAPVTIIDLRDALLKAKQKGLLFHKTDTHWNYYGAFWAYRQIMKAMDFPGAEPMDISDFTLHKKDLKGGDLYKLLSLSDMFSDEDVIFHPVKPLRSVLGKPGNYANPCWDPNTPIVVKEIDDPRLPKIVIFRDSFFIDLLNFSAEHFQRSVFLWTMTFDKDIIEKEHPDIVVTQLIERDIERLSDVKIKEYLDVGKPKQDGKNNKSK